MAVELNVIKELSFPSTEKSIYQATYRNMRDQAIGSRLIKHMECDQTAQTLLASVFEIAREFNFEQEYPHFDLTEDQQSMHTNLVKFQRAITTRCGQHGHDYKHAVIETANRINRAIESGIDVREIAVAFLDSSAAYVFNPMLAGLSSMDYRR